MSWLRPKQTTYSQQQKLAFLDRQRVQECHQLVTIFAHFFGYIARECITRDELEQLIAYGISPDDLAANFRQRLQQQQGLNLGTQTLRAMSFTVKLTKRWRERHVYLVGKTGMGKTNLLRTMIVQDTTAGNGVGVIAPEPEMLTEQILPYIAEDRIDDVIYIDPADTQRPVPLNPLHVAEDETIDRKIDDLLTIFQRVVGDATPRMTEILYHTFYALMERPGATLMDVEILLSPGGEQMRRGIIDRSENPRTVRFFKELYPRLEKQNAFMPITSRIGMLISPKYVRNLLCQPGCLNVRRAMDEGKILLFNVSDGLLGEQTAEILGQLIVSKIQLAAMSRADTPAAKRRPFYLYLDEFQTFTGVVGKSYERMLSRARKYALSMTLAHQQTGQLPADLLREILGNVSTMICFQVSSHDAERLSREMQLQDMEGSVRDLPPGELLVLQTGEAYIKIGTQTFFMNTHLFTIPPYTPVDEIIERSRQQYGVPPDDDDEGQRNKSRPNRPRPNRPDPSQVF